MDGAVHAELFTRPAGAAVLAFSLKDETLPDDIHPTNRPFFAQGLRKRLSVYVWYVCPYLHLALAEVSVREGAVNVTVTVRNLANGASAGDGKAVMLLFAPRSERSCNGQLLSSFPYFEDRWAMRGCSLLYSNGKVLWCMRSSTGQKRYVDRRAFMLCRWEGYPTGCA